MKKQCVMTLLITLIFLLTMLIISARDSTGKEDIQVFCYIGDRNNNEYIGTIDIYDPLKASQYCNMLYIDCNMKCTGCYIDFNSNEICR